MRVNTFDFLRLMAALAVVVQHATVHLDSRFLWVDPYDKVWFYDGVPAFFIISGLFVFRSAVKLHGSEGGWWTFYVNRFLRVAPAIWAYTLVFACFGLLAGLLRFSDLGSSGGGAWLLSSLLLVPVYSPAFLDGFGVGSANGSLWTIPAEVSFYIVVPLMVMALSRLKWRWVVVLLGATGWGAVLVLMTLGESLPGRLFGLTFVPYLWFFTLGIVWYFVADHIELTRMRFILSVILYITVTWIGYQLDSELRPLVVLVAAVPLSYAIVYVGYNGPRVFQLITRRIGDLSFGTYIWHMPVVNTLIWLDFVGVVGRVWAVPVVLIASLVLAYLSWTFVERVALRQKRVSSRGVTSA